MANSSTTCSNDLERLQTLKQYLQKKMVADGPDVHLKPIRTKQEKRVCRDVSVDGSSSEYYAESPVAVPFRWESQPGTPITRNRESLIPPLSLPPSFTQSPCRKHVTEQPKSASLLQNVLPRLNLGKSSPRKAPPPHFEPHPLSYSVPSSPCKATPLAGRWRSSYTSSSESKAKSDDCESDPLISCLSLGRLRLHARSRGSSSDSSATTPHSFTHSPAQKTLDALKALLKH